MPSFVTVRPRHHRPTPVARPRAPRLAVALFSVAIFVNAALLFTLEPMFSKMVLPLLGGTPSVWNTCLLFFQGALLAGYGYAWVVARWPLARQLTVHLGLLALSLATLPIAVARGWTPPGDAAPIPWLIALLALSLGAPFLLLAAGAPLLQRWFSRTDDPAAGDPYFLYASSNLGSLIALLAYPFVLEPNARLSTQSMGWSVAYVALILMLGACAWLVWRRATRPAASLAAADTADRIPASVAGAPPRVNDASPPRTSAHRTSARHTESPPLPPTAALRLRWVLLSAAPSSLLLGLTTYLTTDIAPVPLLWVVPLALYLLTFVLVFARDPLIEHDTMLGMQTFAVLALTLLFALGSQKHVTTLAPIHLIAFFTTAMVCHGELARSKPHVSHLTDFYLWIAVGGLVGGAFNVLVAPRLFTSVLEYPIALVAACMLRPTTSERRGARERVLDLALPALLAVLIVAVERAGLPAKLGRSGEALACAGFALTCLAFHRRPLRFGLGVAAIMMALAFARGPDRTELFAARSFFGVYRVRGYPGYHVLQHGTTTHGGQSTLASLRREPLTYYHREGPLGQMFASLMLRSANRRVAIVGLGTGTIACYARAGERWTYFEIDPLMVRIATDPRYFTYVRDCAPSTRVVLGDARLSLAREPDGAYDLIILDAFSSDAIPAHLMTREALALYLRKLAPGGVVAFHISNRYLRLEPVLSELALDARLAGAFGADTGLTRAQRTMNKSTSQWVALSRRAGDLAILARQPGWRPLRPRSDVRLWTDDFSDILSVFAW